MVISERAKLEKLRLALQAYRTERELFSNWRRRKRGEELFNDFVERVRRGGATKGAKILRCLLEQRISFLEEADAGVYRGASELIAKMSTHVAEEIENGSAYELATLLGRIDAKVRLLEVRTIEGQISGRTLTALQGVKLITEDLADLREGPTEPESWLASPSILVGGAVILP